MADGGDRKLPYLMREPTPFRQVTIFVSSGSDMLQQRGQFEELVREVNNQIHWAEWPPGAAFNLQVVRWEQDASRKAGGDPNSEFRRQARRAHLTVVLLHDNIRPGTLEEIEAALEEPDAQIALIWMSDNKKSRRKEIAKLRAFLKEKENLILRHDTGEPNTDGAWNAMFRVIARVVAEVAKPQADHAFKPQEILYEQR